MRSSERKTNMLSGEGSGHRLGRPQLVLLLAAGATLLLLGGCIAYVHTSLPVVVGVEGYHHYPEYYGRPHSHYYCYDCHGYTYFDPYYDYCVRFGFRFRWDNYPSLKRYYREHYPVIVRKTPHFGQYKYKPDYRNAPRYSKPPDYQTWKSSEGRTYYKAKESSGAKSSSGKSTGKKSTRGESSSEKASRGKSSRGK